MRAVLTFHDISRGVSPLQFPPAHFSALLDSLAGAGFSFVDLDDLLSPVAPEHALAITFDDGYASVLEHALPVLQALGAPAHLFVPTAFVEARSFEDRPVALLSWQELKTLSAARVSIENHTHSHRDLRMLEDQAIVSDCDTADANIETYIGRRPRYFAYPLGRYDDRVRRLIDGRYAAALTTQLRPLGEAEDLTRVPRIDAFYLRSPIGARLFRSRIGPAWLSLRRTLRHLRGSE